MRWSSIFLNSLVLGVMPAAPLFAGERAFVTNQNSSDVSIVDLEARREIARVDVPGKAAGVAVSATRFYTVSPDDARLREFSHAGALCRELLLSGGPIAIALDEARGRAFVTDWFQAQVFVIELEPWEITKRLATGSAPSGVALSHDGRFLATADRDADLVSLFDAATLEKLGTVKTEARPFGVTFSEAGLIYVTNVGSNSVSVIDPLRLEKIADIPTGERPYGVAFAGGQGFVTDQYGDQITIFDEDTHAVLAAVEAGEYPEGIDVSGDESEVYVANWFSNTLSVMDSESHERLAEIEVGDGPRAFGLFVKEGSDADCEDAF